MKYKLSTEEGNSQPQFRDRGVLHFIDCCSRKSLYRHGHEIGDCNLFDLLDWIPFLVVVEPVMGLHMDSYVADICEELFADFTLHSQFAAIVGFHVRSQIGFSCKRLFTNVATI